MVIIRISLKTICWRDVVLLLSWQLSFLRMSSGSQMNGFDHLWQQGGGGRRRDCTDCALITRSAAGGDESTHFLLT